MPHRISAGEGEPEKGCLFHQWAPALCLFLGWGDKGAVAAPPKQPVWSWGLQGWADGQNLLGCSADTARLGQWLVHMLHFKGCSDFNVTILP